jgi:glutathione synthase/RimK-type ligase-like ATP-grasp enzyme
MQRVTFGVTALRALGPHVLSTRSGSARESIVSRRNAVVILAATDDVHAAAVARSICERDEGITPLIVDTGLFPKDLLIDITPERWTLRHQDFVVSSDEVISIWWRRRQPHVIGQSVRDASARAFALAECIHAFDHLGLADRYLVVNRLDHDFAANRKLYQLEVARECGLAVPAYHVTNDQAVLERLLERSRSVGERFIYKTLTAPTNTFGETRALTTQHWEERNALSLGPVIFQRRIEARRHLRITIVGSNIFVHEIVCSNEKVRELPDWRLDVTAQSRGSSLDATNRGKFLSVMKRLGLHYGAIDAIEDDQGTLYFLEVNTQGQFLFNEIDSGESICAAFASLLCKGLCDRLTYTAAEAI